MTASSGPQCAERPLHGQDKPGEAKVPGRKRDGSARIVKISGLNGVIQIQLIYLSFFLIIARCARGRQPGTCRKVSGPGGGATCSKAGLVRKEDRETDAKETPLPVPGQIYPERHPHTLLQASQTPGTEEKPYEP